MSHFIKIKLALRLHENVSLISLSAWEASLLVLCLYHCYAWKWLLVDIDSLILLEEYLTWLMLFVESSSERHIMCESVSISLIRTIFCILLVCLRGLELHVSQMDNFIFHLRFKKEVAFVMPHGNVGRVGYCLGSFISKDGLLELEGLVPFHFSMVTMIELGWVAHF